MRMSRSGRVSGQTLTAENKRFDRLAARLAASPEAIPVLERDFPEPKIPIRSRNGFWGEPETALRSRNGISRSQKSGSGPGTGFGGIARVASRPGIGFRGQKNGVPVPELVFGGPETAFRRRNGILGSFDLPNWTRIGTMNRLCHRSTGVLASGFWRRLAASSRFTHQDGARTHRRDGCTTRFMEKTAGLRRAT